MQKLRFGLVGAAGRPTAFLDAFEKSGKAELCAACDLNEEAMEKALHDLPAVLRFTDYEKMLNETHLDAVIVGTPIPLHVSQSILALERGVAVYSEIPLGETVDDLKTLRACVKRSHAMFMAGENVIFSKPYMVLTEMIRQGVFGELLYAEGEYLHDCRELIEKTPWRKKCLYETRGLTYGTHSLGPILRWFSFDRIKSVCCVGSKRPSSNAMLGDNATVMLCKTQNNRLIKIRMDISSPHPYGLNFVLQGEKAAYQGGRAEEDHDENNIYVENVSEKGRWQALETMENDYLPPLWRKEEVRAQGGKHGGADTAAMIAFIEALAAGEKSPVDIDEGIRMTLPGIISRESIARGGQWVLVPDPEEWEN